MYTYIYIVYIVYLYVYIDILTPIYCHRLIESEMDKNGYAMMNKRIYEYV